MIRRLIILTLVLGAALFGAGALLLFTESGLKVSLAIVPRLTNGAVKIDGGKGILAGDADLEGVVVDLPEFRLDVAQLSLSWRPADLLKRRLQVGRLALNDVSLALRNAQQQSDVPQGGGVRLPLFTLPLDFAIESLTADNVVVEAENMTHPVVVNHLSIAASGSRQDLELKQLVVRAPSFETTLHGALRLVESLPVELAGDWRYTVPGCRLLQGTVKAGGPLAGPSLTIELTQPQQVSISGEFRDLFNRAGGRIAATGKNLNPAEICEAWPEASVDLDVGVDGSADDYRGSVTISAALPDNEPARLELGVNGSSEGLSVDRGVVDWRDNRAQIVGTLKWPDELVWQSSVRLESLDLSNFGDLPGGTIKGTLELQGRFGKQGLTYQATATEISGKVLPIEEELSGSLSVTGDENHLKIGEARLVVGKGVAALTGELGWADGFEWQAGLVMHDFDPAVLADMPQGSIEAALKSSGHVDGAKTTFAAEIEQLSGTFGGYDLSGSGSVSFRENRLEVDHLKLLNGKNHLLVKGSVGDAIDLEFDIRGDDLERFLPDLHGNVLLQGLLAGTRDQPMVEATATAENLTFQDNSVDRITVSATYGKDRKDVGKVDMDIAGMVVGGYRADRLQGQVSGGLADHRIDLHLNSTVADLSVQAIGGWGQDHAWRGRLINLLVKQQAHDDWGQRGAASLEASADSLRLDDFCLDSGASGMCLSGERLSSGGWRVDLSAGRLALGELNRFKLLDIPINGMLQAELSLQGDGAEIAKGSATITIPEVSMNLDTGEMYPDFRWFDTQVSAEFSDRQLDVRVASRFVDNSRLSGDLQIDDLGDLTAPLTDLPISGKVAVDHVDLTMLSRLTDDYLIPSGIVDGSFQVGGNVGAPHLSGAVHLRDGQIRFPELGITLKELDGTVESDGARLNVTLTGVSGNGPAHGAGTLDFSGEHWSGDFRISGRDAELFNQSELKITATPDVRLLIGPEGGQLSGTILIPHGSIEPEEMSGSESESEDVVYVDAQGEDSAWPFSFDLMVTLGDQVRVKGYGLDSRLTGSLQVKKNDVEEMRGRGELNIASGTFALYGRPLEISRGRIIFGGGLIDNPELDISAQKAVKSTRMNSEGMVVGINVSGTVHDYTVELFSTPKMEDRDILTYILLDKPISSGSDQSKGLVNEAVEAVGLSQGSQLISGLTGILPIDDVHFESAVGNREASLVVGKSLTEDLSISYDFNLFDNTGFFRIRYEFGRGFAIESRNAVESNAVELLYSIER